MYPQSDAISDLLLSNVFEEYEFEHRIQGIKDPFVRQVLDYHSLWQVWQLRRSAYKNRYTEITDFENDQYDLNAVVFYHLKLSGQVDGTLRCVLDSPTGLPDESLFVPHSNDFRSKGLTIAEAGRTAVSTKTRNVQVIKSLYSALYTAVTQLKIDVVLMAVPQNKVRFHQKIWNTEILCFNTGYTFGSNEEFATLAWHISQTRPHFFHWMKKGRSGKGACHSREEVR
jgi:hypothetical protein